LAEPRNELVLDFWDDDLEDESYHCIWKIILPISMDTGEIINIKNWVDNKCKDRLKAQLPWLNRKNEEQIPAEYYFHVVGRGEDGRCDYCQSFRTSLINHMNSLNIQSKENRKCPLLNRDISRQRLGLQSKEINDKQRRIREEIKKRKN